MQRREITMKLVMNMVRKPFKQGDVIFETTERSDELYLIHTGSVEIRSHCSARWPLSWVSSSAPPPPLPGPTR